MAAKFRLQFLCPEDPPQPWKAWISPACGQLTVPSRCGRKATGFPGALCLRLLYPRWHCYAMAENVFAVTQGGIDEPLTVDVIDRDSFQTERLARPPEAGQAAMRIPSAGRPIRNTQVRILSDDERASAFRTGRWARLPCTATAC